jgi:uncharacterized protein
MKTRLPYNGLSFFAALFLAAAGAITLQAQRGLPAAIPNTTQYDLKSRINGQTYRIWISKPLNFDPVVAYPVFYVLDANVNIATAASVEAKLTNDNEVTPAFVVGIGYPTDDLAESARRRTFDLTPFPYKGSIALPSGSKSGGGDVFLRVIEDEVKPFVSSRFKVDSKRQTLYGYSLSGLLALRALFRNPKAFSTNILSSPSIFYNNREVLADEEAFSKRASSGELHLKILVTSAGNEQYGGDDPALLAESSASRMIENASELADRFAALNPANITVTRTIFPDETHNSVGPISLTRAIRFALPPPD